MTPTGEIEIILELEGKEETNEKTASLEIRVIQEKLVQSEWTIAKSNGFYNVNYSLRKLF